VPGEAAITVLLADDHALVRRGFRRLLEDDPSIRVVGEASSGSEAVDLALQLKPQVVLMDCAMADLGGVDATRQLLRKMPDVAVVMLSMHAEETLVRQALDSGARGYLLKSALDLDLAGAVKRAAAGEEVIDPALRRPETKRGERSSALTPRELEVLRLICAGRSNREIAAELALSVNTVGVHRTHIMEALGVHKTAELVAYAIRNGLVTLP
jgi:DNA-binding NarL/FixJ family response regulator